MSNNREINSGFRPRHRDIMPYDDYKANRDEYLRLGEKANYTGNPLHKLSPGDYQLNPPCAARINKSLCNTVNIIHRGDATKLLREAFRHGSISAKKENITGIWPKYVWALTADGHPVEAAYDSHGYHGYPISDKHTPLINEIVKRWHNVD
jgi:hypothetical protein